MRSTQWLLITLITYITCLLRFTVSYDVSFTYTGGQQTWIVPQGVNIVTAVLCGASGGGTNYYGIVCSGGKGGKATATFNVTPGDTLYVYVGGAGTTATGQSEINGGYNGGGTGGGLSGSAGGGTDIRIGGTALSNRIVVAGGGGGAGGVAYSNCCTNGGTGGHPNGGSGGSSGCGANGGTGGTQTAGGSKNGQFGVGGTVSSPSYGGPGGGGWYGGGAGAAGGTAASGGGGGSSYSAGFYNTYNNGVCSGNGYVTLTVATPMPTGYPTSQPSIQPSTQPSSSPTSSPTVQQYTILEYTGGNADNNVDDSTMYEVEYTFSGLGNNGYSRPWYINVNQYTTGYSQANGQYLSVYAGFNGKFNQICSTCSSSDGTCHQWISCCTNIEITSLINNAMGGALTVITRSNSNWLVPCPVNGSSILVQYIMSEGSAYPTYSPTTLSSVVNFAPTLTPTDSSDINANSGSNSKTSPILTAKASIVGILLFGLLFVIIGSVLVSTNNQQGANTHQLSMLPVLGFMLVLGCTMFSQLSLTYVCFTKEHYLLYGIALVGVRLFSIIPAIALSMTLWNARTETSKLLDHGHILKNNKFYPLFLFICGFELYLFRYLPWTLSPFVKSTGGFPSPFVFKVALMGSAAQSVGLLAIQAILIDQAINNDEWSSLNSYNRLTLLFSVGFTGFNALIKLLEVGITMSSLHHHKTHSTKDNALEMRDSSLYRVNEDYNNPMFR